ncbi:hypothetical protein AAFF_G00395590 [Aldrovandia affinis]|uniref:Uncharacterized protein n=1 Tax=Aldrovandia affinis TaxID=143900 RepID=A0AAD7SD77_9TELE|nr:hypothetical protein AAFF_G00395590 [Aldrovandia affinis]
MGSSYSAEEAAQLSYDEAINFYKKNVQTGGFPDVGIDESLLVYSGLNSNAVLRDYSRELEQHLVINTGTYVRALATAIGSFTAVPNAVGLGALLISMVINLALLPSKETAESSAGLLRRVFAEEKSSEVRDLMAEYVKRYEMFLRNERRLIEETRRLEQQLSLQLTRLGNSMLLDGHMSSRALKQWVNGAAFHAQMVIHVARLERGDSAQPRAAIRRYQTELTKLLSRYKEYKASTHRVGLAMEMYCPKLNRRRRYSEYYCGMCDYELGKKAEVLFNKHSCNNDVVSPYLDHMFSVFGQITGMVNYFSDLDINLEKLIAQHGEFRVK